MSQARPVARRTVALRAAGAGATSPRLGLALLVIATAQLMVLLDATIVNVALPHIQHALGFSGSGGLARGPAGQKAKARRPSSPACSLISPRYTGCWSRSATSACA
jgi:hypothetical protein